MKEIQLQSNQNGIITVNQQVITDIVKKELIDVVGVYESEKNAILEVLDKLTRKVKINQDEESYELTIPIKVIYGVNIQATAFSVQERIAYALASMLGLSNVEINILVDQVVIPK